MENWNSKFLKLKSYIPENFYKDKAHLQESRHLKQSAKNVKIMKKSEILNKKFKNKISKSLLKESFRKMESSCDASDEGALKESLKEEDDELVNGEQDGGEEQDNGEEEEKEENLTFNIQQEQVKKPKKRDALGQLKTILNKKSKLEKLKDVDPQKSLELEKEHQWKKANAQATGKKVKDDPVLLRKALQRSRHEKNKSEKEWKTRNANLKKTMVEKQKKRNLNIQNRKDKKKAGKSKAGKGGKSKAGKARPGFEGKKSRK